MGANASISAAQTEPATGNYYYVQAGYFKTRANAEKLNDKLLKKGYESSVATLVKYNMEFYRVKVGHFKTKAEAEEASKRLRKDGYFTKVCR
jgi:cell division protein FtsN